MSSILNTTATMLHSSRLPPGITRAQVIAMLSDYEFFLSCDPLLSKFESIPHGPSAPFSVPERVSSQLRSSKTPETASSEAVSSEHTDPTTTAATTSPSQTAEAEETTAIVPTCYRVTDVVHAIPAGIWDTNVVSTYEFVDVRDGVFVRIRSPLSVVMETFWEVRAVERSGEEGDGKEVPELVEDVTIRCSRLLVGLVKKECENGWKKIHAKMYKRLEDMKDGNV
ncbi:hypothetical protein VTK26DRAFT_6984 [Humicola hyalothermophila]